MYTEGVSRPFHEPLTAPVAETFRRASAIAELTRIYARGGDKEMFWRGRMLQRLSRECFRRVPAHPTRWWEYPWVYNAVRFNLAGRIPHVVDLAALGSPMPIAFDRLGISCAVVDPASDEDRIDYGRWGCRVQRGTACRARLPRGNAGFVTGVAAFSGLDAQAHRLGIRCLTDALEEEGLMALTLELERGTRLLSSGESVDDFFQGCDGLTVVHQELAPVRGEADVLGVIFHRV